MMEKENINNNIEEDLNRRNRNWDKISALISDVDGLSSNVDGLISDVNDLSSDVDNLINYVGDLETLTTDEKSTIVGALNEIDSNIKSHLAEYVSLNITNELMNGWVSQVSGLRLIKSPNTLTVHGNIKGGVVTKSTTIAILPEGIRPNTQYRVPVFCFGNPAIVVQMNVFPDGRLTVDNNYDWPTAPSYYFNFTLPL